MLINAAFLVELFERAFVTRRTLPEDTEVAFS
jgi:hypothetical protein